MAIAKSLKLFDRAKKVLVAGVNSPVRSFRSVAADPLVMEKGAGARIFDADGNGYTDYCLSWGALILGHAHKDVISAVKKATQQGTSFGATTKAEIDIAEFLTKNIPSLEKVRFVNSGTEATMSAIRLARGFTGRNLIIKFDGCYHGHFDDLLIKAGSGVLNLKEASSLGIAQEHIQNTLSLPYNNTAVFAQILDQHKDKIACVIIEPVAGNMGVIPAKKDFLKMIRELTKKHGIVLIFDEIITGFRTNLGGAQVEMGIIPDLTCLGKVIGGGFPVGAYGGREDIMKHLAPEGGVYQAGTFSGNPVAMSAGLATLKNLNGSFYKKLNFQCDQFARKLNDFFNKNNVSCFLTNYGSMMSLWFKATPVLDFQQAKAANTGVLYGRLFKLLLSKKIYWPPADLESFFISGAHSSKDLDQLLREIQNFFRIRA